MPNNELEIELQEIMVYAMRGAVIGVLLLIVIGIWLIIRRRQIG